jgi:predicted nuclease with RNAse H fold
MGAGGPVAPRSAAPTAWVGVDVGGRRKGFHVAVIVSARGRLAVVERPRRLLTPSAAATWIGVWRPRLVGVDAPRQLGDYPPRFRGERRLAREVCRLRYTPTREALERQKRGRAPKYYEWIEHGLELYEALGRAGLTAIEAFPTASWTRWCGPRHGQSRARWSARALRRLRVRGAPRVMGQDERDAIGAALTAWAHDAGETEPFGDIVVPLGRLVFQSGGGAGRAE